MHFSPFPVKHFLRGLPAALLELLYPSRCLACRQPLAGGRLPRLCAVCLEEIELLTGPLCPGCGRLFPKAAGGDHFCGLCLRGTYHFHRARAVAHYAEPLSGIIHRLKYGGETWGLSSFRKLLELVPAAAPSREPELILPVPLHPAKLRQRGFNQAVLLARAFFPHHRQLLRTDLLLRTQPTAAQTSLSGRARRRNLRRAFAVKAPAKVEGRRVLLVDDVFTTGTTVNECARVLKKAGADEIEVLTLARVKE